MVWKVALVGGLAVLIAVVAIFVALIPRSSGDGWRLDPAAAWREPHPDELEPSAVVYHADAGSVGVGVTVYGDASCPPELRGVDVGQGELRVVIADRKGFISWTCNLGARPYQFGIVVERDRLSHLPFDVLVHHDDRPRTTIVIDSLP